MQRYSSCPTLGKNGGLISPARPTILKILTRFLDIIRAYQCKLLYDNYKMFNLWIYRDGLVKAFEKQVLATYVTLFQRKVTRITVANVVPVPIITKRRLF